MASLKQRLEAEGLRVGYGDTTTESGVHDPHYLLTVLSANGEDGLWVMEDWGLTPVVHRAYRTPRIGTVDPEAVTVHEAVMDIKQLLGITDNDDTARAVHRDEAHTARGTQAAQATSGPYRPEEK